MGKRLRRIAGQAGRPSSWSGFAPLSAKAELGGKGGLGGGCVGGGDNSGSGGRRHSRSGGAVSQAVGEMGDPGSEVSRRTAQGFVLLGVRPGARPRPRGDTLGVSGRAGRWGPAGLTQGPAATMAVPGPGVPGRSAVRVCLPRAERTRAGNWLSLPGPSSPTYADHNPTPSTSVLGRLSVCC